MGRRGRAAALGISLFVAGGCASSPPVAATGDTFEEAPAPSPAAVADPQPPLPVDEAEPASGAAGEERAVDETGRSPAAGAAAAPESAAAATAPVPSASPAAPPRQPASEPVRRQMIVIDEGSGQVRPEPGELARTTRRDAAASRGPAPRVTNDNLADYASRGRVSISGTPAAPAGEEDAAPATGESEAAAAGEPVRDEPWWRAQVRGVREEWRRTVDEIAELEETAADLRWRFYAADDPWVRDAQVKPEWDRALDRLSDARRRLGDYPRQLEALLEEGRRAGALPGWLRDGVELEPGPEELPAAAPDPAEPVEPRQVDDQRGRGR
jgi:hypothetical protein